MSNQTALPDTGFMRINQILAPAGPIPVPSRSNWALVSQSGVWKTYAS